jgi:hypothetical protein
MDLFFSAKIEARLGWANKKRVKKIIKNKQTSYIFSSAMLDEMIQPVYNS